MNAKEKRPPIDLKELEAQDNGPGGKETGPLTYMGEENGAGGGIRHRLPWGQILVTAVIALVAAMIMMLGYAASRGDVRDVDTRVTEAIGGIQEQVDTAVGASVEDIQSTADTALTEANSAKDALTGYALKTSLPNLGPYALITYVDSVAANCTCNLTGYATEEYVNEVVSENCTIDLTGYATEEYVNDAIADNCTCDLTGYATTEYVDEWDLWLLSKIMDCATEEDVSGVVADLYGAIADNCTLDLTVTSGSVTVDVPNSGSVIVQITFIPKAPFVAVGASIDLAQKGLHSPAPVTLGSAVPTYTLYYDGSDYRVSSITWYMGPQVLPGTWGYTINSGGHYRVVAEVLAYGSTN